MSKKATPPRSSVLPPITREQHKHAKPVVVSVAGRDHLAHPREFATGSCGWYLNEKQVFEVVDPTDPQGKVPYQVQINVTITVIGSKDLPRVTEPIPPKATPATNL